MKCCARPSLDEFMSCKLDANASAFTDLPSLLLNHPCVRATLRHTSDWHELFLNLAARFRSEVLRLNDDELKNR